jgi:hypothetical protein
MYNRLNSFIKSFNIITNSQHGFRENCSTNTAAFDFTEKIYPNIETRQSTIGMFIDLSKAFDMVDHSILLNKLFNIGVRGITLKLFESYLQDRKQCVFISSVEGAALSDVETVRIGVPQGSILGPILYLIYVNDFVAAIADCYSSLYADDTSVLVTEQANTNIKNAVCKKLSEIKQLFSSHKLVIYE